MGKEIQNALDLSSTNNALKIIITSNTVIRLPQKNESSPIPQNPHKLFIYKLQQGKDKATTNCSMYRTLCLKPIKSSNNPNKYISIAPAPISCIDNLTTKSAMLFSNNTATAKQPPIREAGKITIPGNPEGISSLKCMYLRRDADFGNSCNQVNNIYTTAAELRNANMR
jgi:hypothetical protein